MVSIKLLEKNYITLLVVAFEQVGWSKSTLLFQQYLEEQEKNQRLVWVAFKENVVAGYGTLKWQSQYPYFKERNIAEINDLNVLPQFRNQGIGSCLLDIAEKAADAQGRAVGLGVGLYADYGAAQKLYVKRGYVPDGNGVTYDYQSVKPGSMVCLDDNLVLWLKKR